MNEKRFKNIDWDSVVDKIIIYGMMLLICIGATSILILIINLILGV